MSQGKQFLITILIIVAVLTAMAVHFLFFLETSLDHPTSRDINEAYHLNALIIRFRSFDSVIAGTSLSQNFKCSSFDKVTGGFSYKLTVSGGKIWQTCKIIDFACRKQKIKYVLLDLNPQALMWGGPPESGRGSDEMHYYSENSLPGDLCDGTTLWSLKDREKYYKRRRSTENDDPSEWSRDDIYNWEVKRPCSREAFAHDIRQNVAGRSAPERRQSYLSFNIHDNLLPLVRRYPDIRFYLFLPPLTPFAYIGSEDAVPARKAIMDAFLPLPNVRLYDFQSCTEVCMNYDKYCDAVHYSSEISEWILEQIKNDSFRVTPQNRSAFEKRFSDMLASFQAEKEVREMVRYSREHPLHKAGE